MLTVIGKLFLLKEHTLLLCFPFMWIKSTMVQHHLFSRQNCGNCSPQGEFGDIRLLEVMTLKNYENFRVNRRFTEYRKNTWEDTDGYIFSMGGEFYNSGSCVWWSANIAA